MRTAHRFADEDVAVRSARTMRAGRILLSRGAREAARVNPVVVWLDAGLAVLDAANAYLKYATEKHQTRELRLRTRDLEEQLAHAMKRMDMEHEEWMAIGRDRIQELEQAAREMNVSGQARVERFAADDQMLALLKQMVVACRESAESDFEYLLELQCRLDALIRATLDIRLASLSQF